MFVIGASPFKVFPSCFTELKTAKVATTSKIIINPQEHSESRWRCNGNSLMRFTRSKIARYRGVREFPFSSIPKNESLLFPVRNYGNGFFHSLPVPEFWEWIFSFPSRSRISGMDFFHSLPVPEFREWIFSIPFPFPNFGNGFFNSLPVPESSKVIPAHPCFDKAFRFYVFSISSNST